MTIPKAIRSATIAIFPGFDLHVYVLENGQRIIEAVDMERFFTYLGGGRELDDEVAFLLAKVVKEL